MMISKKHSDRLESILQRRVPLAIGGRSDDGRSRLVVLPSRRGTRTQGRMARMAQTGDGGRGLGKKRSGRRRTQEERSAETRESLVAAAIEGLAEVGYVRSEEHTSELQSPMRISNAVLCVNNKK